MTHYFKSGNIINLQASDSMGVLDYLPADVYVIKKNDMTNTLYLQTANHFELPSKIYGEYVQRADRVINTFNSRNNSTGILLTGDKGAGKTLLTKIIANKLIDDNIPVIIVNEPACGPIFNELIGKITQPAMILFDEFDKVYDAEQQKELLTLLDGTIQTKKLFVFTANDGTIDQHMINRPGRIYYKFKYSGIDEQFVRDYCNDRLNNKQFIDSIVVVSNSFTAFTFDMLQSLVEEMNRYNEDATSSLKYLNIDLNKEYNQYTVSVLYKGVPITNTYYPRYIDNNPLFGNGRDIDVYTDGNKHTFKEEDNIPSLMLDKRSFSKISKGGVLTFKFDYNDDVILVILEKKQEFSYNWNLF